MNYVRLNVHDHARRFAVVCEIGDDVLEVLQHFCEHERVESASIAGIGGFKNATVAYFDVQAKRYAPIAIDEQVEVLSFLGNVTLYQDKPKIHVHCVLGHRDGHTSGGHLLRGTAGPTLELIVDELPSKLHRTDRPQIGLPLIEL